MPTDFDDIMRRTLKEQESGTNSIASASAPIDNAAPAASSPDSFSPALDTLATSVKKQTPVVVNVDDGQETASKVMKAPSESSETAPGKSEAVQLQELQNENALRMKGLEIALGLWKEQRADENRLRDREMQFDLWKRQHDVEAADRKIEKLSGARDVKWTYHGTFANGVLTSTFTGSATNPYKEVINQLGRSGSPGEPGAPGSFKYSDSESRRSGFEVPDWLKGLIPDGTSGFRKTSSELDFKPSPAVSGDRKVKSVLTAYSPAGSFLGVDSSGNSLFGERTKTTSTLYSDGTSTLKEGKTNVLFRAAPDRNNALARLLENMG